MVQWTPQLPSAFFTDSDVVSTAIPIFSRSQLKGTTTNTALPNRKLLIQDDGHKNGSTHNYVSLLKYQIATRSQPIYTHFRSSKSMEQTLKLPDHAKVVNQKWRT